MKQPEPKDYIIHLTVEQFYQMHQSFMLEQQKAIVKATQEILREFIEEERKVDDNNFVYGLKGLAKVLSVSKSKAARIKASGVIDEAIQQNGNIIRIDSELAVKLYFDKTNE